MHDILVWVECRQTPLRHIIPFDDAISFHSGAGLFGVFLAIVHSLCHIVNFISCVSSCL